MSILPLQRIQCDTCRFGIRGAYQHACHICAPDLIAEADGTKARAA